MKKEKKQNITQSIPSPLERARVRLKICGMKYQDNIKAVARLQPNYLGFIFHEESPRNFDGVIPELPKSIKKVGVFVDKDLDFIKNKIDTFQLNAVQLHGNESPEFCKMLKKYGHSERSEESQQELPASTGTIEIIKVFSIKDKFDFSVLAPYEGVCDYFLFDTKGKLPGGNGYAFDWSVLTNYPSTKPFFLSGGIGLNDIDTFLSFLRSHESKYCYAIDVNSKFEIEPGLKNIEKLEKFKQNLPFRT